MAQVQSPHDVALPAPDTRSVDTPVNSGPHGYPMNSPTDEIDLVELLGFFWKIKVELCAGALVGLLIGGLLAWKILPTTYRTEIPLTLDRNEKTTLDVAMLVSLYNNEINTSGNARQIWRSVFNQSPEFARALRANELSDDDLASAQALAAKPEKAPLRLRASASPRDFVLEVQLPVKGLPERTAEVFAAAIQNALMVSTATDENEKEAAAKLNAAGESSALVAPSYQQDWKSEMREQLLRSRQELLKIEYLCSKLSRGLNDASVFLGDANSKTLQVAAPANLDAASVQEIISVQGQFERIQRMVAVLLAEGRMKTEDANDTVLRAMQVRDDIIQLMPEVRKETVKIFNQTQLKRSAARGEIRAGMPSESLPILLAASTSGTVNSLDFEKPSNNRKVAPILGAFLGAFVGFAFGGLRVFLRRNVKRLREVIA